MNQQPSPLTAVAYLRTARSEPSTAEQLQRQQTRCHELARSIGAHITAVFADHGISGTSTDRPGLNRLLEHIDRERVDVVIAASPDRLARDRRLMTELCWQIEMCGATLLTDEPGIDESAA